MRINNTSTSTPVELVAGRQTVLACLLLAQRLIISPHEIAKNLRPGSGETPVQTFARLIEWQQEMMEEIYQQK